MKTLLLLSVLLVSGCTFSGPSWVVGRPSVDNEFKQAVQHDITALHKRLTALEQDKK